MTDQANISELANKLFSAKRAEEQAKSQRIEIEEQIAALVETPDNGSKTVDAGDGIKVTVKRSMSYKADTDAIRNLGLAEESLPLKFVPAKPAGYAFDDKAYEKLVEDCPSVAAKLSEFVTVTPRKVGVTLKLG